MGLGVLVGVKNFSVGICDGAPSTARSSMLIGNHMLTFRFGCKLAGYNILMLVC